MTKKMAELVFSKERTELMAELPVGMCCYRVMEGKSLGEKLYFYNANEIFYKNIGYSWEEFAQKEYQIAKCLIAEDRYLLETNIEHALSNPSKVYSGHYGIRKKSGKTEHTQWHFKYLEMGERGRYLICICSSVEDMVQSQAALAKELDREKQERRKLNNLIYEMPVGMAVIRGGNEWTLEEANNEFFRPSGYMVQEIMKKNIPLVELVYEEDTSVFATAMETCRIQKDSGEFEVRIRTKEGGLHWVLCKCQLYYYKEAVPYYIMANWDINDRKALEDELKLLNERYKMLEEGADELPFDYDVEKRRFRIPQKYFEIGKIENQRSEYQGYRETIADIYEEDRANFERIIEAASEKEMTGFVDYRLNLAAESKKCNYVWHRTYYHSIAGRTGKVIRIIGRTYDINNDQQIKERMSEELKREPLTHLFNKVATQTEVKDFLAKNPDSVHVMSLIDIDNFKKINDTFGHTFGDTVISDVASKIKKHFKSTDIVGRIGGDEFLVLMKNTTLEEAEEKAESLCKIVRKRYSGDGVEQMVTLSVGMAVYNVDGQTYEELFEKADRAMYRTKQNGKNSYSFALLNEQGEVVKESETEDDYERRLETDKEFLHFAFSLLTHARDLDGSLNVLLEHIGKKYGLDLVSVFEYEEDTKEMTLTNYWGTEEEFYRKQVFQRVIEEFELASIGEFVVASQHTTNITKDVIEHDVKRLRRPDEYMKSVAGCKFEFSGNRVGCVHFATAEEKLDWTQVEISTLQELTRVISVFVTLRNKIKEDQREIRHLQNRDKLTGLYNMEAFRGITRQALIDSDPNKTYALIMCDINNFSYINENFGQDVGDNILFQFARTVLENAPGVIASCRMYSDYFAVLTEVNDATEIVDYIGAANNRFERQQNERYPASGLSIATGIYVIKNILVDLETAIENANLARKQAKERKVKNGVVYEPSMRQKRDEELQVSGQFFDALAEGEFEVFLQPKFCLKEGTIYGAEALARWRKPDGTLIPPVQFIPALEKFGYIIDLDFYIYEQLLAKMKKWKEDGKELFTISTNFSGRHFSGDNSMFVERISKTIKKYDIDPKYIEIEVTESILIENVEELKLCLKELRSLGFRVAIDDFGTGYSSLSVLLEIPADVVKIDKSFIRRADLKKQRDFVTHMGDFISYAKEEVIFEGIESQEQLDFLISCNFEHGQGYIFDKPLDMNEFEKKYIYN
ncbi:MAG: diguanylate cyclase domain-containing protein [Roseburia sp.]